MQISLPDVQYILRPGVIEFRLGHPDLALLPAAGLLEATRVVLEREAPQALSYGAERGPGCLISQLCDWLERTEGAAPSSEQVMITGGSSQAMDMLCMLLTQPGDLALVESPTYHLALRVLRDHQLELMQIPSDEDGLQVDALEETLNSLQRQGRKARLLYLVPTFNNPSGVTLELERRKALVALAQRTGLIVVEDDVYHELWYDAPSPPSLHSLLTAAPVIRLGSFSKILAPGLRLGWMFASPELVARCTKSGVLDSGGGLGHFTAHVVAAFIELGLLDQHVERLRTKYRERRDVLINALERYLPEECYWVSPGGGFFVWLRLPPGVDSSAFLPVAEAEGVSYVPGPRFYAHGGGECYCRLNFTLVSLDDLEAGARRFSDALHRYLR
ncbi:MAG: PLP-dependent aminotransferase family protein [Desulfobacteraceae bacterium]|jgi:DNA-binding transcriptional MocR family regulator